jgi:hypothetical protein
VSQEITQAHCNRCGDSTKHDILASDNEDWEYWEGADEHGNDGYFLHEMLKCRGCGSVTLRLTTKYPNDGPPTVVYYPPAVARRAPAWVWPDITTITLAELGLVDDPPPIPFPIVNLMREIYAAVQNGLTRLAAMGIRAALESVMIDKVGDKNSFKTNLDAFQGADYLSVRQRGHLEIILNVGHAAMHREWNPTGNDVKVLLDITEKHDTGRISA